jgi:hypothetical protein
MELNNMLDLVHYMFEDDMVTASVEQSRIRQLARKNFYRDVYEMDYVYAVAQDGTAGGGVTFDDDDVLDDDLGDVAPLDPKRQTATKNYFAPTALKDDAVKPFGAVLDAPLS